MVMMAVGKACQTHVVCLFWAMARGVSSPNPGRAQKDSSSFPASHDPMTPFYKTKTLIWCWKLCWFLELDHCITFREFFNNDFYIFGRVKYWFAFLFCPSYKAILYCLKRKKKTFIVQTEHYPHCTSVNCLFDLRLVWAQRSSLPSNSMMVVTAVVLQKM